MDMLLWTYVVGMLHFFSERVCISMSLGYFELAVFVVVGGVARDNDNDDDNDDDYY